MTSFNEPETGCSRCPRLVTFRNSNCLAEPEWHNAPVRSYGSPTASFMIVGLAPGLKGANKTGIPFIGDGSGDLLYKMLLEFAFAEGTYNSRTIEGLKLKNCLITNAVRCVPPQNKPNASELANCLDYLTSTIECMKNLKLILALGKVAHDAIIKGLGLKLKQYQFKHHGVHVVSEKFKLIDSYHCSRYNLNTKRLTETMFREVFRESHKLISEL